MSERIVCTFCGMEGHHASNCKRRTMRKPIITYDWATLIDQLVNDGHTTRSLSDVLGMEVSGRMLVHYRRCGNQPTFWRGERIITFWCQHFGKTRADAPTMEVTRGHRADRRNNLAAPRLQDLPQWPPTPPAAVKTIKRGRTRKVPVAA